MDSNIEFYFRELQTQINDSYRDGQLDTLSHNSIILTINSLEQLVKEDKQIYPCEHIVRDIAKCKWKECVKLECPKNKKNPDNR